jgi:hypothetical protein
MVEKCCYNKILRNLFWGKKKMKTREDKQMIKKIKNKIPLQNCILWAFIKKNITFTFWCMVIPFDPHWILHLVRGPKAL